MFCSAPRLGAISSRLLLILLVHYYCSILASLNLPAAIEDVSGTDLPNSVKEKASKIQSVGGLEALDKLLQDLPDAVTRNREILDEVRTSQLAKYFQEAMGIVSSI